MAYEVRPVVKPVDLAGQQNGRLDMGLMTTVPNGMMHHLAADAWVAMCAAAFAEAGVVLTPSSGFDSYRTFDMQDRGFHAHYTLDVLPGRPTKTLGGKTFFLRPGFFEAARPGESNHGLGLAIDVAGLDVDEKTNAISNWVLTNYTRFGFSHEHKKKTDPPHIRYFAGDAIPAEVGGKVVPNPVPVFDPDNGLFSLWPLNPKKDRILMGAEGDIVRYAEGVLRLKVGLPITINGIFDQAMFDFVTAFQRSNNLEADGKIGKDTWAMIDKFTVA